MDFELTRRYRTDDVDYVDVRLAGHVVWSGTFRAKDDDAVAWQMFARELFWLLDPKMDPRNNNLDNLEERDDG